MQALLGSQTRVLTFHPLLIVARPSTGPLRVSWYYFYTQMVRAVFEMPDNGGSGPPPVELTTVYLNHVPNI